MTEPPLGLFIQPACLQHKYIRHPNASHIFERPERLRAVLLGVAAAVSRLEEAEETLTKSLPKSEADDLSSMLSGLSIQSSFISPRHLSIVDPPRPKTAGQVLLHHPALQLSHSPPSSSSALVDGGPIPSSSYLKNLHKWASEALETIKLTGCEIPSGLGLNQGDLYLGPGSILAIEGAIQTVCQAIDKVCDYLPSEHIKEAPSTPPHNTQSEGSGINKAFCAIRPPGHHCGEDLPSGFCYVNNVVVGALHAYLEHDIERAIIIDFDLHHGNGTQALVMPLNEASHAEDLAIKGGKPPSGPVGKDGKRRRGWKGFYGSVHDIYSYPCEDGDLDLVKDASLSLAAHGQYIENIHLQPYTTEQDFYERIYPKYLTLLDKAMTFMEETGAIPEKTIVLISAGFDACEHEHQGMQRHDRRVPTSFFSRYTKDIVSFANQYTAGKVVSVLEGGYSDRALTSASMGHVIGMLNKKSQDEWWSEPELINIEKAIKKKRNGRIAPLSSEYTSHPHLVRTHALLGHFETVGATPETTALPPSVTSTPQGMSTSGSGSRMTLRERRKIQGGEEEVTPPPTAARRGRGTNTNTHTPRGKVAAGPSTPLARKAVSSKFITPPHTTSYEDLGTPRNAPTISAVPTLPVAAVETRELSSTPTPTSAPAPNNPQPAPDPVPSSTSAPKIILRFTRPTTLPPAELASLPSPITPLPPSQSTSYPLLPQLNESSIDQRLAYRQEPQSTSEDYLSARNARMPRPNDSPDVATSKTLAYILRHGAEKESLHIRTDGYIKLDDVLARPKMRGIDVETVLKLVEENAKKRFEVVWGYDPSPPLPKKKSQSKKQKAKVPVEVDAAGVDDLSKEMEQATLGTVKEEEWEELPLIVVDKDGGNVNGNAGTDTPATWFIRASQGHSIKLEGTAHLTPVEDNEEGRERVGMMVHGTRDDLWDIIRETGLSKMDRQHIHLAPAVENHRITPRPSSRLYIYLDLSKVLAAGIKVYTSANGVVLSPGDEDGRIQKEMWSKVERKVRGERVLIWRDGKDVGLPGEGA